MNKADAYERLETLVSSYKKRFEMVGVRSEYEVYFLNAKSFKEAAADEDADSLCASVTLITSSGEEELCGFDITADIAHGGDVDEEKLNDTIADFSRDADDFLAKIATSENKDALIRAAAEQEKTRLQANIDAFNSDVKRLQTRTMILAAVAVAVIFIAVFAFIGR